MNYEFGIGWRYLYRGEGSARVKFGLIVGLIILAVGAGMLVTASGASPAGVLTVVAGLLVAIVFGLLQLFTVFTTVSILGVILGVAALTVVLAVTTGFQEQFREKVLGVNAHVIITKNADFRAPGPQGYRQVERVAREIDDEVVAVQPFIFVEMLVTRGQGVASGVAIKGVDPVRITEVLDLSRHMVEGSVQSLQQVREARVDDAMTGSDGDEPEAGAGAKPTPTLAPIILGRELARKLKAKMGDEVTVVAPLSNIDVKTWSSRGEAPKTRTFRISGIFYSGFAEYDNRLMYISLTEAQALLGRGDQVMGIELKVKDVDRAKEIADKLDEALGGAPFVVQDWYELNRNLFTALTLQKRALTIILTLIIVVATFNMVSALTMMVIDKTREIAILRSMGATSQSIAKIFQVVGLTIGVAGTIVGLIIGLTLCSAVSSYGYHLDPKVYLIDRLPITVKPNEIILIAVVTMVISGIAAYFPSAKASSLRPVEGLRYD